MSQQLSIRDPSSTSSSRLRGTHLYESISRERWEEAVRRAAHGHVYRGQGSSPAVRNLVGCVLVQRAGNRADKGYVQLDPPRLTAAHTREPEMAWQLAHRIVCFLTKPTEDVCKMLYDGFDASHRCHMSKCINPEHLVVETHDANMSRRQCEGRVDVVATVNGGDWLLPCPLPCPHQPPCINQRERRDAVECKYPEREQQEYKSQQKDEVIYLD